MQVNFYVSEKRNRKNDAGQWESYDAYTVKEKFCYWRARQQIGFPCSAFYKADARGSSCDSVPYVLLGWEQNVGNAFESFPYAWVLHVATRVQHL
jgi:hypothetical protein